MKKIQKLSDIYLKCTSADAELLWMLNMVPRFSGPCPQIKSPLLRPSKQINICHYYYLYWLLQFYHHYYNALCCLFNASSPHFLEEIQRYKHKKSIIVQTLMARKSEHGCPRECSNFSLITWCVSVQDLMSAVSF